MGKRKKRPRGWESKNFACCGAAAGPRRRLQNLDGKRAAACAEIDGALGCCGGAAGPRRRLQNLGCGFGPPLAHKSTRGARTAVQPTGKFTRVRYPRRDYDSSYTVRLFISRGSFWVTHCHQKCVRKEISHAGFLDVNRWGFKSPIDLRRGVEFCYVTKYLVRST